MWELHLFYLFTHLLPWSSARWACLCYWLAYMVILSTSLGQNPLSSMNLVIALLNLYTVYQWSLLVQSLIDKVLSNANAGQIQKLQCMSILKHNFHRLSVKNCKFCETWLPLMKWISIMTHKIEHKVIISNYWRVIMLTLNRVALTQHL